MPVLQLNLTTTSHKLAHIDCILDHVPCRCTSMGLLKELFFHIAIVSLTPLNHTKHQLHKRCQFESQQSYHYLITSVPWMFLQHQQPNFNVLKFTLRGYSHDSGMKLIPERVSFQNEVRAAFTCANRPTLAHVV